MGHQQQTQQAIIASSTHRPSIGADYNDILNRSITSPDFAQPNDVGLVQVADTSSQILELETQKIKTQSSSL